MTFIVTVFFLPVNPTLIIVVGYHNTLTHYDDAIPTVQGVPWFVTIIQFLFGVYLPNIT